MDMDERIAEMTLAIQQLTHTMNSIEMNQQKRVMPIHSHERNTEGTPCRLDISDF